jgi:hypothetical protein
MDDVVAEGVQCNRGRFCRGLHELDLIALGILDFEPSAAVATTLNARRNRDLMGSQIPSQLLGIRRVVGHMVESIDGSFTGR